MYRSLASYLTYAFGIATLASTLLAVDGVLLIDQNRALAGNVTPGDTPGFPITISQPGSYRLSSNLVVPNALTSAIRLQASHVTIDLNGFAILGAVDCSGGFLPSCAGAPAPGPSGAPPSAGDGIEVPEGTYVFNVTIRNGTIQGMGRSGIRLFGDSNLVEYVHTRSNGQTGILITHSPDDGMSIVQHCTVQRNGGNGVSLLRGRISNSTVDINGGAGVYMGKGNVANNVISRNAQFGIEVTSSDRVSFYGNVLDDNSVNFDSDAVNQGQNLCNGAPCP